MTPKKLKVGKVIETIEYMIEFKWLRSWGVSGVYRTEKALVRHLKRKRKEFPNHTFRAVQIVKTPMEETDL